MMIKHRTLRPDWAAFYIKIAFAITAGGSDGPGGVWRHPHQYCLSFCQQGINDRFNKTEQTEAGHRLVCEGHRTTLYSPHLYLRLSSPSASHSMQDGHDLPKKQINKPLTGRERQLLWKHWPHFNLLPLNSEKCLSGVPNCSVWSHIHTCCSLGMLNGRPWLPKVFQHCKCATMGLYSFALGTGFRNSNILQPQAWSLALMS